MKQLWTVWGRNCEKDHILQEYPRPQLVRKSYFNLNGYWDYAISNSKKYGDYIKFAGKILVPFSPEAALSGVERQLKPKEYLWYRRKFTFYDRISENGGRLLLHFGAVDQSCKVYVNGQKAGWHMGGYTPFTIDITEYLNGRDEEVCVCVKDKSEKSTLGRGKQSLKRGGMFYTAQSGIWQSVWLEWVPDVYIKKVRCKADSKTGEVVFQIESEVKASLKIEIFKPEMDPQGKMSAEACKLANSIPEHSGSEELLCEWVAAGTGWKAKLVVPEKDICLWSPEAPYLYYYRITYGEDIIKGYFAFRSFTVGQDEKGRPRICLNGEPYYQNGVLDQGYWPEGLYTPPSDTALMYDILKMKELGYNMLRKHIKVEADRFYYHCDRLGMIVWQDMINGGAPYKFWFVTYLATLMNELNIRIKDNCYRLLSRKDKKGWKYFEKEMKETVRHLENHPCISTWVVFNEGWGQFDAIGMTEKIKALDSDRIIDSTSGWFDQGCGDLRSQHYYFFRLRLQWEKIRATVLSEYGGYVYRVKEHSACDKVYGYKTFESKETFRKAYEELMGKLIEPERERGLSAAVYTQLSDVEEEVNGILTYDREVCKLDVES